MFIQIICNKYKNKWKEKILLSKNCIFIEFSIQLHNLLKYEICLGQINWDKKKLFKLSIVTEDLQFSLSSIGFTLLSEIMQRVDCLMWCDLCASVWGVEKDPICWPTTKVSLWQIPLHVHTTKWVHKSWIILELAYINQISWVDHFCFFLWSSTIQNCLSSTIDAQIYSADLGVFKLQLVNQDKTCPYSNICPISWESSLFSIPEP